MGSKYLTVGVAAKLTVHVPVLLVHGVKQVIGLRLVFWFERGLSKKAVLNERIGFLKYLLSVSLVSSGGSFEANCTSFGLGIGRLSFIIRTSLPRLQLELVGES